MVHPLVVDSHGADGPEVCRNAVLRQHGQAVARDHLRDAVVDFRVDVVGPARQQDAFLVVVRHPLQGLPPFLPHVLLGLFLLLPGGVHGSAHFPGGNAPFLFAQAHQPVGGNLFAGKGHEGADVAHLALRHVLHVVFQVLGIGAYHGAVVVVLGGVHLLMLIKHAGVKNRFHALVDQPLHMAVGQLGGVALAFGGDGLHAQVIDFPGGHRRQAHGKAQLGKECMPEGIVFPHVQHPRNADFAPGRVLQGLKVEHAPELVRAHVGPLVPADGLAQAPFAAVAGDMAAAAGEQVHGEHTMVFTALAVGGAGFPLQAQNFIQRQHGRAPARIVPPSDQRRAESAHHARDVGADGFRAADLFKGPQHGGVVERAALHHDAAAQVAGVGQLDHLEQRVADDGIGQARADVLHRRAFLLCLLHVAVHEHGAASAQIQRRRGEQRFGGEALGGVAHGVGEIFQKGAAARGAGFVQQDGVHRAVFQLDALHILPADVQHTVHLGIEKAGGGHMGDGFHFALVQRKGGFHQLFPVARGAGPGNERAFRQLFFQFAQGGDGGFQGISLVARVKRPKQFAVFPDQGQLGGGAARVHAQIAGAGIGG